MEYIPVESLEPEVVKKLASKKEMDMTQRDVYKRQLHRLHEVSCKMFTQKILIYHFNRERRLLGLTLFCLLYTSKYRQPQCSDHPKVKQYKRP